MAAGEWLWITPYPKKPLRNANVRRPPPVQKSGSPEEQKKRTIHLLQNRTFLFALDMNDWGNWHGEIGLCFHYGVGWRGGISPPRSHGSGRDSLPSSGSYHPAARLTQRFYLIPWLLSSLVDQTIRPDDPTPSLHPHYRNFYTVGSEEAPRKAGLRPPLKPSVQFSRTRLSQRLPVWQVL
jgi:hypothetical protein